MMYIGDIKKLLGERVFVEFEQHKISGVLSFAGYSDLSRIMMKQSKDRYYTITVDRFPIRVPTNKLNKLKIKIIND